MAFDLNGFRNNMQDGGARPQLFEMDITFPGALAPQQPFLTKVSEIPGSTVGVIEVPYFGRKLKVAGERSFATLSCTVINDESYRLRGRFERWMKGIADHDNATGASRLNNYQRRLRLTQRRRDGGISAIYTFHSAFPTSVGTIALDWSSTDTIEEYTVEFQYQYWDNDYTSNGSGVTVGITAAIGGTFIGATLET